MVMASNKYAELLTVAKKAAQAGAQVMHTPISSMHRLRL